MTTKTATAKSAPAARKAPVRKSTVNPKAAAVAKAEVAKATRRPAVKVDSKLTDEQVYNRRINGETWRSIAAAAYPSLAWDEKNHDGGRVLRAFQRHQRVVKAAEEAAKAKAPARRRSPRKAPVA